MLICKIKFGVASRLWAITQQGRERTQSPPNGSEWHRSAPSAKDLCQKSQSQDEKDVSKRQSVKDADAEDATLRQAKTLATAAMKMMVALGTPDTGDNNAK